jgi:membrane-associated protease RseP (regulator of RpoE activity)
MNKSHKLMIALLVVVLCAVVLPVVASDMCNQCKENPEKCKMTLGDKCENPECQAEHSQKTIEKKIIVLNPDDNRGFLGVYTVTKDGGVVIEQIVPESPAEKAGLAEGMVIKVIKGAKISTKEELVEVLKNTKPKDTVAVVVKSDSKEKTVQVVLGEAPKSEHQKYKIWINPGEFESEEMEMPISWIMKETECPKCGHKMEMKTGEMKIKVMGKCPECGMEDMDLEMCPHCNKKMEPCMPDMPKMGEMPMIPEIPMTAPRGFIGVVTEEDDGQLVIMSVVPKSPAEKAGLQKGDIISEINSITISTPQELIDVLKTTKPGDVAHLKIVSGASSKMVDVTLATPPQVPQPMKMEMKKIRIGRKHAKPGRGAGYFGPGVTMFKYDRLNAMFARHGLDTLKNRQFVFGGGGWGQVGRVRLGGYGLGGGLTVDNDTVSVDVSYGVGFFEVGYALINAKHFMLTPLLGIGGCGLDMKISKLHPITNIDSLLSDPGGKIQVSKGGFAMYPGLAIDIPISFVGLSLKGGYIWSPMMSAWTQEGSAIKTNDPEVNLSGPFASLGIMFGGGK